MRKLLLLILLIFFISGSAFAVDHFYTPGFTWKSPEILGQGGSYAANGQGYNSLLVNPASFIKSREKQLDNGEIKQRGELTILSLGAGYTADIFTIMEEMRAQEKELIEIILDQATSNGLGASVQIGGGYVGRGFGFGLMTVAEFDAPVVETTLGLTADLYVTTGLVAGYAHPFEMGAFKMVVGGDIRPMYRVVVPNLEVASLMGGMMSGSGDGFSLENLPAFGGAALALDAGVDFYWRDFIGSVVMRDIGNTRFYYKPLETVGGINFSGEEPDGVFVTPWTVSLGAAYNPTLGKINKIIDTTIHGTFTQPLAGEDSLTGVRDQSFWTRLDLGAEVVLLSSVALRAGLQGGYFTAGFGLDLFFIELQAALYTEEYGSHAGDEPKMGGALEFAIRF